MKTLNIPEGYNRVMPYLIIENAGAFMDFAKKVFGAEEKDKVMRSENVIMHAELNIGGSIIMLADATEQYQRQPAGLFVYVEDCDTVYNIALANGATGKMAPSDQPYGRSGGVNDAFGNTWWITSA